MRQRNEKGLQSTTRKDLRRAKTKRHNVPDSRRALHMHVLERDFGIRAACMQHDCATCASMLRDAVTAAQSRFLATKPTVQGDNVCDERQATRLLHRHRKPSSVKETDEGIANPSTVKGTRNDEHALPLAC